MKALLARFARQDDGQDLIEYALLAALVAVASVAAITTLAAAINSTFGKAEAELNKVK